MSEASVLSPDDLQRLIDTLGARGYSVIGPTVDNGAIVYEPITGADALPTGRGDEQAGGHYRLTDRGDSEVFGFTVGPQGWKRHLHPPEQVLWTARRRGRGFTVEGTGTDATAHAFLGVRPCELSAIVAQDQVLTGGPFADTGYRARRDGTFLVAVNCGRPAATCFCASMGTGPAADGHYDIVLTEVADGDRHIYYAEAGSEAGRDVLATMNAAPAADADREAAHRVVETARANMGRHLETDGLPEVLRANLDHPRYEKVAERCLNCGNCTMVCPTCFCTTVEDVTDLTGSEAVRVRRWDSCFTAGHSTIHGIVIRGSTANRYRQWLTHKLGGWHDQFGRSGCVGCGRCITWCPVGIDITEEAAAIQASERSR